MMQRLVFFATSWGTKHGGVNSFNFSLVKALAQVVPQEQYRVTCVLPGGECDAAAEARSLGVELLCLSPDSRDGQLPENRAHEVLSLLGATAERDVAWWLGHDVQSGPIALQCKQLGRIGKFAVFHHTHYLAYRALKAGSGQSALDADNLQRRLFEAADLVVAVGPKLAMHARELLPTVDHARKVHKLIPGLPKIDPRAAPEGFSALLVGRLDPEDAIVKQGALAVASVAECVKQNANFPSNPTIIMIGVSDDKVAQVKAGMLELAARRSNRVINIVVAPFAEDHGQVLDRIAMASVVLVPSFHEGFGLAAWEAIGAGTPVVISENSGVYQLIREELHGGGTGRLRAVDVRASLQELEVNEQDVVSLSAAIQAIAADQQEAKVNALDLRKALQKYDWSLAAVSLAQACEIRSVFLRGTKPGDYIRQFVEEDSGFEEIVRTRTLHYSALFSALRADPDAANYLILFGGVATKLCDDEAAKRYAVWLVENPRAQLFVCYESGEPLIDRYRSLLSLGHATPGEIKRRPESLAEEKIARVLNLRQLLASTLSESMVKRVSFIELSSVLTNYLIVTDRLFYVAPALHMRSTETVSMRLNRHSQVTEQFSGYLLHHLRASGTPDAATSLIALVARFGSQMST